MTTIEDTPDPADAEAELKATAAEIGHEDSHLLAVPIGLAAATAAIGRRLTLDVAKQTFGVGREMVDGAREGKTAPELAEVAMNGWLQTMRSMMGITQDFDAFGNNIGKLGSSMTEFAGPMAQNFSGQVRNIAGLSSQDIRKQLRADGQALLHRSCGLDDPDEHTSFRTILREMSPDEARIVRYLALNGAYPILDVIEYQPMTKNSREALHHMSLLGNEAGCLRPELASIHLDDLNRLGLVHIRRYRVKSQEHYDLLYAQPAFKDLPKPTGFLAKYKVQHNGVELSEFGRRLYDLCFAPDGEEIGRKTI